MVRVHSACLCEIIHFRIDSRLPKEEAILKIQREREDFVSKSKDKIKIIQERTLENGSIVMSIRKKVPGYEVGKYFD